MAKRKQVVAEGQGALFGDKKKTTVARERGRKGKVPGLAHPGRTIPEESGPKPKLYAGLDIHGLVEMFSVIAKEHGAEYESKSWGGAGKLVLTPENLDKMTNFVTAMLSACKTYKVNASFNGRSNFAIDEPFIQVTFVIPGELVESKHA